MLSYARCGIIAVVFLDERAEEGDRETLNKDVDSRRPDGMMLNNLKSLYHSK